MNNKERKDELLKKVENKIKSLTNSDDFKLFLKQMSKFHNYSIDNINLILAQKNDASRVAGFKSWQNNFNRKVKKGSKAIYIQAPMIKKLTPEEQKELKTSNEYKITGFKFVPVFDISDTEGDKVLSAYDFVKNFKSNSEQELYSLYKKEAVANYITEKYNIPVTFEDIDVPGVHGYYNASEHYIKIDTEFTHSQQLKTLFHEFTHSLMHNKTSELSNEPRNIKEIHAEAVAYLCMEIQNFDTSSYSIGYIATWAENFELVKKALQDIHEMFGIGLSAIKDTEIDMDKILQKENTLETICQSIGLTTDTSSLQTYHDVFEKEGKNILDNLKFLSAKAIEEFKNEIGEAATNFLESKPEFKELLSKKQEQNLNESIKNESKIIQTVDHSR